MNDDLKRIQDKYGDILLAPVDELEFTIRVTNCFASDGIKQVKDLVELTEVELFRMPGFGKKSLKEVEEVLASYNLRLNTKLLDEYPSGDMPPQPVLPSINQSVRHSLNYTLRVAADQAHSNCVNNEPEKAQLFINIIVNIFELLTARKEA